MATERIISIAQTVYDYLKANRVGAQTTTSEALAEAYPDIVPIQSEDDLWDIDEALYRIVKKEREFVLDPGEYRDTVTGLPFNCPFIECTSFQTDKAITLLYKTHDIIIQVSLKINYTISLRVAWSMRNWLPHDC